jgi:hypothetical protein
MPSNRQRTKRLSINAEGFDTVLNCSSGGGVTFILAPIIGRSGANFLDAA